jgi:chromosome segregation ATPase
MENRKRQTMTNVIQLSIIGGIVFVASYIILQLLRNNERLIAELDDAKAEARTLDADLDEARRSNGKANAYIEQLYAQLDVMDIRLSKYKKQAKGYEISLNALDAEHRKTIQHLYGRIGAMQRKINRLKSLP